MKVMKENNYNYIEFQCKCLFEILLLESDRSVGISVVVSWKYLSHTKPDLPCPHLTLSWPFTLTTPRFIALRPKSLPERLVWYGRLVTRTISAQLNRTACFSTLIRTTLSTSNSHALYLLIRTSHKPSCSFQRTERGSHALPYSLSCLDLHNNDAAPDWPLTKNPAFSTLILNHTSFFLPHALTTPSVWQTFPYFPFFEMFLSRYIFRRICCISKTDLSVQNFLLNLSKTLSLYNLSIILLSF